MEPTREARLPGPLAWPQTGKGKGPGSDFSSSLIYKKKRKMEKQKPVKGTFPGYMALLSNKLSTRGDVDTSRRSYLGLQGYLHI